MNQTSKPATQVKRTPSSRMTKLQRISLGIMSAASVVCLVLSRRSLADDAGNNQAMGGVIFGAVAIFLPVIWLIFLSGYRAKARLFSAAAICFAASLFWQFGEVTDQSLAVILSFAFAAIGGICLLSWFIFHRSKVRWGVLASVLAAVGLFFIVFRVEGWTGNMVPVLRPRFSPSADQQLEKLSTGSQAEGIDLLTTTEQDFPRFLGTNADGKLTTTTAFSEDWASSPPKLLWRQPIGAGWSGFAIVNGYAVTLEQRAQEELVTCYNLQTGKVEWSNAIQARHDSALGGVGPRSTPTIDRGRVYALGATGVLRCLDGSTGKAIWSYDILTENKISPDVEAATVTWGRAASPLIVDDMVIVPIGGPESNRISLAAFHVETGEQLWQGGNSQVSYCSPQLVRLDGVRQILTVNEASVAGHDISTGKPLWLFPWYGQSNGAASNSQAHVLPGDRVLISKGYGAGAALFQIRHSGDTWTVDAEPIWQSNRVLKTKLANAIVKDGVAIGLSEGILEAVDLETGKRLWRNGRFGHGQILLVDNLLLVISEAGELILGKPSSTSWTELGRIQAVEGKTWNNLAISGDLVLVRNAEEAACYRLPMVSSSAE